MQVVQYLSRHLTSKSKTEAGHVSHYFCTSKPIINYYVTIVEKKGKLRGQWKLKILNNERLERSFSHKINNQSEVAKKSKLSLLTLGIYNQPYLEHVP